VRVVSSPVGIHIGVALPVALGRGSDPVWARDFAQLCEGLGFDEISVVEHAVVVADPVSPYPYSATGRMPLADDCDIPDPLELLAFLAGVTTTIGLSTGVLVVPNHHPVVLAKRLATLDRLSGGRLRVCVGVGWMREEVEACGRDFGTRGAYTDEAIAAMRTLWGTPPASFDGKFVRFRDAYSMPRPTRPSGVPLYIGGHSHAAARRAGRLGDGFQPLGLAGSELDAVLDTLRSAAAQAGRQAGEVDLVLGAGAGRAEPDTIESARARGAGLVLVSVSPRLETTAQITEQLSGCAERLGLSA
jgi:probable F420-dependent oxidoreductase